MAESAPSTAASGSAGIRAGAVLVVVAIGLGALMLLMGDAAYPWIKAAHVMAIIAWMAGLLYLPRLFIYHCDAPAGSAQSETFKVMERRLLNVIMTPAMAFAWGLGLWLAYAGGHLTSGWFLTKFALVFVLSGLHGRFSAGVRAFAEDRNDKPQRYWRIMNEVPAILMAAIVILAVVKPF